MIHIHALAPFNVCFHEAGHAIASIHLRHGLQRVSVREVDNSLGRMAYTHKRMVSEVWLEACNILKRRYGELSPKMELMRQQRINKLRNHWRREVKVMLAGEIAEKLYLDRHLSRETFWSVSDWITAKEGLVQNGSRGDWEKINRLFGLFSDRDPKFTHERAAWETELLLLEQWPEVISVAVALRKRQELTEDEVKQLTQRKPGPYLG